MSADNKHNVLEQLFSPRGTQQAGQTTNGIPVQGVTCGEFRYTGDSNTLGQRWEIWLERFKIFLTATALSDPVKIKATFLLYMGQEAYHVYKSLRKADESDTIEECYKFMTDYFVAKRSEFSECQIFRRALRAPEEKIDEFAIRLRHLAQHCKFPDTEKEILQQLVYGSNMEEFQRKCCRTDDLTLKDALAFARGY